MLSPVSDSAGADVNIDITINNNSGSDTGNNGNIDLGEDPGVKEPELEETPTARDILTPIINLLPFTNEFNFINLSKLPQGISMIISAMATRFIIRRIPVIG
ncbi:DUF2523 domain-containing protein [Salmonella enterica subsp. houtenae serovar 16:z4,z32:--]